MEGDHGKESKPVLFFSAAKKGLVLNKTNSHTIAASYGPETDNWHGKTVVLYVTQERAFGSMTDCIRLSVPAQVNADQTAAAPADSPF